MNTKGIKFAFFAIVACYCANVFSADYFDPLFRTAKVTGKVWILRPGETEPVRAKEDFRYPYGSKVIVDGIDPTLPKEIVQKNEVMLVFAKDYQIKLAMDTQVTTAKTAATETEDAKVTVGIEKGVVSSFITLSTTKTGDEKEDAKIEAKLNAFVLKTPLAEATRLVERNEIRVGTDANGMVKTKYKIESGSIILTAPQFNIIKTRRKTVFEISGDQEFSHITVLGGEITANIERGEDTPYQGSFKQGSIAKIWRMYTQIQKKLAVAVMMTSPDGKVERYEYIENPSEILKSLQGKTDTIGGASDGSESFDETESTDESDGDFSETSSEDNFGEDESTTEDDSTSESTEDFFDDGGSDDFFGGDDWDF